MITKENFKSLLKTLSFAEEDNIFKKSFSKFLLILAKTII